VIKEVQLKDSAVEEEKVGHAEEGEMTKEFLVRSPSLKQK
jgi:hypothetical protein